MREDSERREKLRREFDRDVGDLRDMHINTTPEEHREHIEYIRDRIERENNRAEMLKEVRKGLVVWITITSLSGAGYLIWRGFLSHLTVPPSISTPGKP